MCTDITERIEYDQDFLKKVITGNESLIFECDPETKMQSLEWHTGNSKGRKNQAHVHLLYGQYRQICSSRAIDKSTFLPSGS